MARRSRPLTHPEMPIAPMIDCVFLMLVYFMTTSSLERSEADLSFPSGIPGLPSDPLPAVDEQTVVILADGKVNWNGTVFSLLGETDEYAGFQTRLRRFRETCTLAGSDPAMRILPEEEAPHQALVRVIDAVTQSGIETFYLP